LAKEPPEELLFNADYRTIKDNLVKKPSRALVETINDKDSINNFKESKKKNSEGGNPYATKRSNLSTAFAKAVLVSAAEGKTLYGDAYKLLNVSNSKTFDNLVRGY
jgi:hypothetical protein